MRGLLEYLHIALRPSARTRTTLLYGSLLAMVLLLSFLALHRGEDPPLKRLTEAGDPAARQPDPTNAPRSVSVPQPVATPPTSTAAPTAPTAAAEGWRALTQFDFAALPVDQLPPDDGNVSPIASEDQAPEGSSAQLLEKVEKALPTWAPGHVSDRVQRVRNYLLILGVADFAQSPIERFLPGGVLAHMLKEFPPAAATTLCRRAVLYTRCNRFHHRNHRVDHPRRGTIPP